MQVPICRHIKTNGLQCHAVAITSGPYCYFHLRLYQRHRSFRHTPITAGYLIPGQHIELSPLEDRESVQVALSVVINALATGQLDSRRATALLYGLQLASHNAKKLDLGFSANSMVRTVQTAPEGSEFAGLDLAEPGATLELDNDVYDLNENDEDDEDVGLEGYDQEEDDQEEDDQEEDDQEEDDQAPDEDRQALDEDHQENPPLHPAQDLPPSQHPRPSQAAG